MAVFGDPEVVRYLSGSTLGRDEVARGVERQIAYQDEYGFSLWAVELRSTGEVIGDTGLMPFQHVGPEVEVGWRLARAHWGRGYATEAAKAAIGHGLADLGLGRIIAVAHPDNAASRRVMEKCGMVYEGIVDAYGKASVRYAIAGEV